MILNLQKSLNQTLGLPPFNSLRNFFFKRFNNSPEISPIFFSFSTSLFLFSFSIFSPNEPIFRCVACQELSLWRYGILPDNSSQIIPLKEHLCLQEEINIYRFRFIRRSVTFAFHVDVLQQKTAVLTSSIPSKNWLFSVNDLFFHVSRPF